jgi:hypothetical protein
MHSCVAGIHLQHSAARKVRNSQRSAARVQPSIPNCLTSLATQGMGPCRVAAELFVLRVRGVGLGALGMLACE